MKHKEKETGIPLIHLIPITRGKLFVASIIYIFLRLFYRNDRCTVQRNGIWYRLDLSEGIDLAVFLSGSFQRYITESSYVSLPANAVILDIGANIGTMSLRFAQLYPNGHVYAFEPAQPIYKRLIDNLSLNPDLAKRITPVRLFVDDKSFKHPKRTVYSSWRVKGVKDSRHPIHGGSANTIPDCESISIDDFCMKYRVNKVDMIKIDTDGNELNVLRGGIDTISKHKPLIIFEIGLNLIRERNNNFYEYYELLSSLGYTLITNHNDQVVTCENFYRHIPIKYTTDIIAIYGHNRLNNECTCSVETKEDEVKNCTQSISQDTNFSGLSIIMPFFGHDSYYARKCLDFIYDSSRNLSQRQKKNLEVIIVDDASPKPFSYENAPMDFHYYRFKRNSGAGASRNMGARLAKYSHLLFIDSDVILEKNYLPMVFATLERKNVKILQGALSVVPANVNPSLFQHYTAIEWNYFFTQYSKYGAFTACMVIEKDLFFKIGGFCESFSGSGGEEFEFSERLWEIGADAIMFDGRLISFHYYDNIPKRIKKLFVRAGRLRPSFIMHKLMPLEFKKNSSIRLLFSTLLTLTIPLFFINPLQAILGYFSFAVLFFLFDIKLSLYFAAHHSWRLAFCSVFFRQLEYSTILCGFVWQRLKVLWP